MATSDDGDGFERELIEAWPLLMGLVIDQRWRWAEVADELGVSQAGVRALLAIDPTDPRPMSDLARDMNCDRSYVTGVVDDLERAGYAERRTAPQDRRVKTIVLTSSGAKALRVVQDKLMAPPTQLSALTPTQQRTLARLLQRAMEGVITSDGVQSSSSHLASVRRDAHPRGPR